MESFYGGKAGFSFVIVKSFPSIAAMVECFRQGGAYTAVHYDEHVLINTENKNDKDNGKLYRRGYDYTNELGGAIYIGTIVGPAGRAPELEMTTIQDVKNKQALEGYAERFTEGSYNINNGSLVPGKNPDNTFNDEIEWACCSIRQPNEENTIAYIGLKFPYLVIDVVSKSEDPYYHRSNNTATFENLELIEKLDDGTHPYYQSWRIHIPKGIHGESGSDFRVIPAANIIEDYPGKDDDVANGREILVYDYTVYDKVPEGETKHIYLGDYNVISSINVDDEGTLTIDYTHDDDAVFTKKIDWIKKVTLDNDTGHFVVQYNNDTVDLGDGTTGQSYETDLNWVKDIDLDDEGTLTFDYSHDPDKVLTKKIDWIKKVTLNKNNGHFTVEYNNDSVDIGDGNTGKFYETDLSWVNNITLATDGTVTLHWSTGETDDLPIGLRWINNMEMKADGTVIVNYNDGTKDTFTKNIQWVKSVTLLQDGTFTVKYNNDAPDYQTVLTWVSDIVIETNGTIEIDYNNGDPKFYTKMLKYIDEIYFDTTDNKFHVIYNTGDDEPVDNVIKYIDHIYIDDDEVSNPNCDYRFHVVYNTADDEPVGEPINYVDSMEIDKIDYHLLVLYSNKNIREALHAANKTRTYRGEEWLDLGSVKDDSGILIGLNVDPSESSSSDITEISNAITFLNGRYPNGLTNAKYYGKIVTIGNADVNKKFYAYDYDIDSWYYLGAFDNTNAWIIIGKETDINISTKKNKLITGGVWFVVEGEDDD